MDPCQCPCGGQIRHLSGFVHHCDTCFAEVEIKCKHCDEPLICKGRLPKYCDEHGLPIDINTIKIIATELKCNNCSETVYRKKAVLNKFCDHCGEPLQYDKLQRFVKPASRGQSQNDHPQDEMPCDEEYIHEKGHNLLPSAVAVAEVAGVAPNKRSTPVLAAGHLPLLDVVVPVARRAKAVTATADAAQSSQVADDQRPLHPADQWPFQGLGGQRHSPSNGKQNSDATGNSGPPTAHSRDATLQEGLVGLGATADVQRAAADVQRAEAWGPPAGPNSSSAKLRNSRLSEPLQQRAGIGDAEAAAVHQTVAGVTVHSPPSHDWGLIQEGAAGRPAELELQASATSQPEVSATVADHLERISREYVAAGVVDWKRAVSDDHSMISLNRPEAGAPATENLSYSNSVGRDNDQLRDPLVTPLDMGAGGGMAPALRQQKGGAPKTNAQSRRESRRSETKGNAIMYPMMMDRMFRVEEVESGYHVDLPTGPVKKEAIEVTFYVTISRSFLFDADKDWPFIEFYSCNPQDQPLRLPLCQQSFPSGHEGWAVTVRLGWRLLSQKQPLEYKYFVEHSATNSGRRLEDTYEWIHRHVEGREVLNRKLCIPAKAASYDRWDQYDLIMLPKDYKDSDYARAKKAVEGLMGKDRGMMERQQKSLHECITADALSGLENMLPDFSLCFKNSSMTGNDVIRCFNEVLSCIRSGKLFFLEESLADLDDDLLKKAVELQLTERTKQWLGQLPADSDATDSNIPQVQYIVAGLSLLALADQHQSEVGPRVNVSQILKSLKVTTLTQPCLPEALSRHFNRARGIYKALRNCMVECAKAGEVGWLFAIPLFHMLSNILASSDPWSCNYRSCAWWGLSQELSYAMQAFQSNVSKFKARKWLPEVSAMSSHSWLSARTFIAALSKEQLLSALDEQLALPLDAYVAAVLGFCLERSTQQLSVQEQALAMGDLLKLVQKRMHQGAAPSMIIPQAELLNSFNIIGEASVDIAISEIFQGCKFLLPTLRLMAFIHELAINACGSQEACRRVAISFVANMQCWFSNTLSFAMADPDGVVFKEDSELEMWTEFFKLSWSDTTVQECWQSLLRDSLCRRIDKISNHSKVAIYCMTEIQNLEFDMIFEESALHAADDVMQNPTAPLDYYDRDTTTVWKFGKILSSAFTKAWPAQLDDLGKLNFMLTWPGFSVCINLTYGEHSEVLGGRCLSTMKECEELLSKCCQRLITGQILYRDLDFLIKHVDSLKRICHQMLSLLAIDDWARDIQKWLELRQREKQQFDDIHDGMRTFVVLCERLGRVELLDLPRKVEEDLNERRIATLWAPQEDLDAFSDHLGCRQFPPGRTHVEPGILIQMRIAQSSLLFLYWWDAAGKKYDNHQKQATGNTDLRMLKIELEDVTMLIWPEAYRHYSDFARRIQNGVSTFGDAETLQRVCMNNTKNITHEVYHLADGADWKTVDSHMQRYSLLHTYSTGAKVMLDLKDKFKLTGDFRDLEVFIKWEASKDRLLSDLSDRLIEAGRKLKAMDDIRKVQCIQAYVDCKELADWVRQNVTEPNELKVFVDLASIVAGEGDHEVEKVSCLLASVTGYSSLIYDFPSDANLQTFLERCEAVWKNLDSNADLPKQLRDTRDNLEWVKSVKDSYGDVEVTSLAQAAALNENGIYKVGFLHHQPIVGGTDFALGNVVRVTVPNRSEAQTGTKAQVPSKTYSYDDLVELHSKLMLVAGKAEQDNAQVETFVSMFRSITRLSQAYVKVYEAGAIWFDRWEFELHCDRKKRSEQAVNVIRGGLPCHTGMGDVTCSEHASKLADFLTRCKEDWTSYMDRQRDEHCELNFFTTKQIAFLRKELGKLKKKLGTRKDQRSPDDDERDCDNKVYPMLAMLAPCNWQDLDEALKQTDKVSHEKEKSISCPNFITAASPAERRPAVSMPERLLAAKLDDSSYRLITELSCQWEKFLADASTSTDDYLSVDHLGRVLEVLARRRSTEPIPRQLPRFARGLQRGQPHLIVCPHGQVLHAVLSLYMTDKSDPIPTRNEVIVCSEATSVEEVDLLLRRAFADELSVYCLAYAHRLKYDVCCHLEKKIDKQHHDKKYLIAVICSDENEDRSRMITALERFRIKDFPVEPLQNLKDYISHNLTVNENPELSAACHDYERCCARLIKSRRCGMGKTLYIRQLIEESSVPAICVQLVQLEVDLKAVLAKLLLESCQPQSDQRRIVYINVAQEVQHGVDELLFNLLILGSISSQQDGFVWQRSKRDYYLIETVPLKMRVKVNDVEMQQDVHSVLELLPCYECMSPQECLQSCSQQTLPKSTGTHPMVAYDPLKKLHDNWQRPCRYLKDHQQKTLGCRSPSAEHWSPRDILTVLLEYTQKYCELTDPSWAELRHFVYFLDTQLKDCEDSDFFTVTARNELPGFVHFIVTFMLKMSGDFATRSLKISKGSQELQWAQQQRGDEFIYGMQMVRSWDSSDHPYIFFNRDHGSLTFLGFCVERRSGNLLVPRTGRVLESKLVSQELFDGLERNGVDLSEDFESKTRMQKIEKICSVMGNNEPHDPDTSYELTSDNVKKILAIHMRFRCGIPVIIMGETGCGKTRLVKFMCDLQIPKGKVPMRNLVLMKIHGGTTARHVEKKVKEAVELAKQNRTLCANVDTVLFLDEANTTDAIGLIKEVMCDGTLDGKPLDNVGLRIVAAVNPYRKHPPAMVERLEKAGLGYHVIANNTKDKLGSVPMRHLVYRVRALPQSLLPLVWDFGKLPPDIEEKYIKQMINKYDQFSGAGMVETTARVLVKCQEFMRSQKDECSFVSLRDIDRVLRVMSWFYQKHDLLFDDDVTADGQPANHCRVTWSLVMALGVCYHACLQPRKRFDFRRIVGSHFHHPLVLPGADKQMLNEIDKCQTLIVNSLSEHIKPNIAHNHALKENIFMMVVCVELRIPLFIVGKPGSSKSLAKTIVADAMQGDNSKSKLFKALKQVHLVSFQCSPLATPEGIIATFKQCARFQKKRNLEKFVSIVVLDEVGLAEDSELMPLKTLHPLLEEGCDGDEQPEEYMKCAFIGISNWALDPAKMNRGILVQRGVPDKKELEESAKGICKFEGRGSNSLDEHIIKLSTAYLKIFDEAVKQREFFGLRDFYSLMKMLAHFAKERGNLPTPYQFQHAILRNFGGTENATILEVFGKHLGKLADIKGLAMGPEDPPCDTIQLIDASLSGRFTKSGGESRYLLVITENDTALSLIQNKLPGDRREIIFGSSFPKDLEYTEVCRNINRIKVCMETGATVTILNLENLYESLYDALNQYYVSLGGRRFVDLGLGTHRVKCRVHSDFRLIVIADREVVHKRFPIPLINRLEKHYVTMASILTDDQNSTVKKLCRWAKQFVLPSADQQRKELPRASAAMTLEDAFIGYSDDAAAAVVLQVTEELLARGIASTEPEVLERAKYKLLLSATPVAVLGLKERVALNESEKVFRLYYNRQQHESLGSMLASVLETNRSSSDLFLQVTTHGKLLSHDDTNVVAQQIAKSVIKEHFRVIYALQAVDTEQQFTAKIRKFYGCMAEKGQKQAGVQGQSDRLLIIQCDAGHDNVKLISCARYVIWREYRKALADESTSSAPGQSKRGAAANLHAGRHHVVLVVQLPQKAKFYGFHGGKWTCVHIDDLRPRKKGLPSIPRVHNKAISEVLEDGLRGDQNGGHEVGPDACDAELSFDTYELLRQCLHEAASRLRDSEDMPDRSVQRLEMLVKLFSKEGNRDFQKLFARHLVQFIRKHESERMTQEMRVRWLSIQVAAMQNVVKFGTFRRGFAAFLERKIAPVFATIIAYADTNCNLDLLESADSQDQSWKARLWLDMFGRADYASSDIALSYDSMKWTEQRCEIPVLTRSASGKAFAPKFPFSWLLKEQMDGMAAQAKDHRDAYEVLQALLLQSAVMTTLAAEEHSAAIDSYLHDYVYLSYRCAAEFEHEILFTTIKTALRASNQLTIPGVHLCCAALQPGLLRVLHILEHDASITPKLLDQLQKNTLKFMWDYNSDSDVIASHFLLENLQPDDSADALAWQSKVQKGLRLVEEVLEVENRTSEISGVVESHRKVRDRLYASCILVDTVLNPLGSTATLPKVIDMTFVYMLFHMLVWGFRQLETIKNLELFLTRCNNEVLATIYGIEEKRCCMCHKEAEEAVGLDLLLCRHLICSQCLNSIVQQAAEGRLCPVCRRTIPIGYTYSPDDPRERESYDQYRSFKELFNCFFMQILAELVFAGHGTPDQDLVKHIISYVTLDGPVPRTKQLSPFADTSMVDTTPIIRSFLLQLLLRSSEGTVNDYVADYFEKMIKLTERHDGPAALEFCILFISCFEDYNVEKLGTSNAAGLSVPAQARDFLNRVLLHQSPAWQLFAEGAALNAHTLRALAELRLCLVIGADIVYKQAVAAGSANRAFARDAETVLSRIQAFCDHAEKDGQCSWPRRFLAKQIIRKHGTSSLHSALAVPSLKFVLPEELENLEQDALLQDPFVIATKSTSYTELREALSSSIVDGNTKALSSYMAAHSQELRPVQDMLSIMALCSVVTRSHYSTLPGACIKPEVKIMLETYMTQAWPLRENMFVGVLRNCLPGRLSISRDLTCGDVMIALLIYRLCAVLLAEEAHPTAIVSPLTALLLDPSSMQDAFFPTMPHDPFQDVKQTMSRMKSDTDCLTPYVCPNNHVYFIGDCGRPYSSGKCPECGSVIGGADHISATGNHKAVGIVDQTKRGHILGTVSPGTVSSRLVVAERDLTPLSCVLVQALLHMTLYASAALNGCEKVAALVHPAPNDILGFLWLHVTSNLGSLQTMLNRSLDDCLVFLHTVVSMLPGVYLADGDGSCWKAQNGRRKWEKTVQSEVLIPAVKSCDRFIEDGMEALKSDLPFTGATLTLSGLLEEPEEPADLRTILSNAAVWRYRERPGIQHFVAQFENYCSTVPCGDSPTPTYRYAVLQKFLRTHVQLAAIRFLPDVLSLITSLSQEYGRQLLRSESKTLSIEAFLNKHERNASRDYRVLIGNFISAWNAVQDRLATHSFWVRGRPLRAPAELCCTIMSLASPLRMLLAATRGPGLCCLALVTYLATLQNDLINTYTEAFRQKLDPGIPLLSASHVHLIAFDADRDLLPIILGNCQYSLKAGEGTLVRYNYDNIQCRVIDRFVRHKRQLMLAGEVEGVSTIPRFLYREDFANSYQFEKLSKTMKCQEDITPELKDVVRREYNGNITELTNTLVIIDQAVGFLATARAVPADMLLSSYLEDILHMADCSINAILLWKLLVSHIKSLWLLLSLERAKAMLLNDQDFFEGLDPVFDQPIDDERIRLNAVASSRSLRHAGVAEKVSEIMYEFVMLRLMDKSQPSGAGDEDSEDVSYMLPSYSLFTTLALYAKEVQEQSTTKRDSLGSTIACLEELGTDFGELQLQHVRSMWKLLNEKKA